ncbi:MAG: penicillin-binding transpeptidase domain-containing protein [Peptoniphilus sp.]|nr:penicillin-binding transpeptidase domain-containing protein [Peptoniphilus sp.]MDD7363681.1 penicillin-binding transpeptidase domain-containing protein [Bacillota bacterium]MDY6044066.1 penicillin-binding transpeptidase domain-containing protein [Peptoniphilus sp.]
MSNFWDRAKSWDRYKIFTGIIVFLLAALLLQLFNLTIIQGHQFRKLADERRVKDIAITAQRGQIRDRNGVVLAGNRPVFAVQLRKDEVDRFSIKERNAAYLRLSRYLEEDGAGYMKSNPIVLDAFVYRNLDDYKKEEGPRKKVVEALSEKENLSRFLQKKWKKPYRGHYEFSILKRLLNQKTFQDAGMAFSGGEVVYTDLQKSREFKELNSLSKNSTAYEDLVQFLIDQPMYIEEILDHPIGRRLAYEVVAKQVPDVGLRAFGNEYYDGYIQSKAKLMDISRDITWESSATSDLASILAKRKPEDFLMSDDDVLKDAVDFAAKKGADISIETVDGRKTVVDKAGNPALNALVDVVTDKKNRVSFLNIEGMPEKVQSYLIDNGIATGISVSGEKPVYTQINNAIDLAKRAGLKGPASSEEIVKAQVEHYELDPKLSPYEVSSVVNVYDSISKQGSYAYMPVHYAYEIQDETVAKIEETLSNKAGIHISVEPIRYYPEGNLASHVLGYIGNIAQDKEIDKYVKKRGYDRNALIGKTGMEQVFEETLKGKDGRRTVTVDSSGNTTDTIREIKPEAGRDVRLSIDIELQKKAEESLATVLQQIRTGEQYTSPWGNFNYLTSKDKGSTYKNAQSGAVVVTNVHTGEVLALANYPSYDPNMFAKGINPTAWESLKPKEEKNQLAPRPLYNIATQSAIQPGSIFKMVTGSAALEKGLDPDMAIQDGGYVDVGGQVFGCWLWNQQRRVHGPETLAGALRDSCNYYFFSLGLGQDQRGGKDIGVRVSESDVAKMAKRFGLSERTGLEIKIPQEGKGTIPDPASKNRTLKALLSNHLRENEKLYMSKIPTEKERKEVIEKIVAALDDKEPMTRDEVYTFLTDLNVEADKIGKGQRVPLADLLKYTYIDQAKWSLADTMNIVIGQGSNAYTPVQICRYAMALANGGKLYPLTLLDGGKKASETVKDVGLKPEYYRDLREGMKLVAVSGVNERLFKEFPVEIAMKTGSAERAGANPYTNETYDAFAWQVGYAPADDPEIAVTVVLFQGGNGANCGPIMQQVMAQYFGFYKEVKDEILPMETGLDTE